MISSATTTTVPLPLTTQAGDLAGPSARQAARAGGGSRSLVELAIQAAAPEVIKLAASVAKSTAKRTATRKSTSSGAGYASSTATRTTKKKASSSTTTKTSSTAAKKTAAELAFLSDPKLTIEEKLMRLMAVLTARYEADMQQHMDRLAGGSGAAAKTTTTKSGTPKSGGTTTGGGSSKKSSGVLGTLAHAVNTFFPVVGMTLDALQNRSVQAALKKIGGPVLAAGATAMGFPQLAPVLLKVGPQIFGAVGDLAKAVDSVASSATTGTGVMKSAISSSSASSSTAATSAASSGSGSSKSSAASGTSNLSDSERQLELMQIQRLQDRQKEMFGLVSNLLRATHDTRAAIIANTRS